MIIRKIKIENYLCYYETNTFELSNGLNIILGENGEGKTKFYEAVEWLFNGENRMLHRLVSAKKLNETEIGDSFRVRVSITVEQYGEKSIITKSFFAKKVEADECSPSNFMIEGIEENSVGERMQVDGQALLDRIFPFQIRKYSMFKGEAELNIFESESALVNLINLFSDAKHYDKYFDKGALLRKKAEKAVENSSKEDKKNEFRYKSLEEEISFLEDKKKKYELLLNATDEEIRKIDEYLQDAEKHVDNAEALETINTRIRRITQEISDVTSRIDENYTTSLFDENWILVNFEPILKQFEEKVSTHSKDRRKLQSEFDRQKGVKEGEKRAKAELLNKTVPLPIGVPSKSHLNEMLNDEICKVCNREAKKGSEAYEFMMERLQTYLESQTVEENVSGDDDQLFKYNYTNRLINLHINHEDNLKNIREIKSKIKQLFEFNDKRKKDVEELNQNFEAEKLEREKILGNSNIAGDRLTNVLKNYNSWQNDLKGKNQFRSNYSTEVINVKKIIKLRKEEKDKIDTNSAHSFLIKTREMLRDIETIFIETKEKKFGEFIEKLQTKSNNFFKTINIDSFTGSIVFQGRNKGDRTVVEVVLKEDGRIFYKPNQSLVTSMHISILFAISELASEIKEENFPLIFDAPTSSFGENKTTQFLNLIYKTETQKILLIKDFIQSEKDTNKLKIKKDFDKVNKDKAFWVKLERPFDPNSLKTINTQVISL